MAVEPKNQHVDVKWSPSERIGRQMRARYARRVAAEREAARAIELHLAETTEPADWQEQHSPTEAVEVRIDHQRTKQTATRRKMDARMWDAMTRAEEQAAECILAAVLIRTGEVGIKARRFDRSVPGPDCSASDRAGRQADLLRRYDRWVQHARTEGLSPSDVIQIIVHGQSCGQQDRDRRQRNGTAKAHLIKALTLFAVQQGWQN